MKNIFVSFANKTCSVYREYSDENELYEFVKDCTGTAVYFVAIENKHVVYEYIRGKSPDKVNRKTFKRSDIRPMNDKDVKRVRYAYGKQLINCSPERFESMWAQAKKEGVI